MKINHILFFLLLFILGSTLAVIFSAATGFVTDDVSGVASGLYAPEFGKVGPIPVLDRIIGGLVMSYDYVNYFFDACQFNWPFLDGIFGFARTILILGVGALMVYLMFQLMTAFRGV